MSSDSPYASSTSLNDYSIPAFFGLVFVQISIGIVYKFSQTSGEYPFSQASALCLAEACKFATSLAFYLIQLKQRGEETHGLLSTSTPASKLSWWNPRNVIEHLAAEVSFKTAMGMVLLSVLYCINNHVIFYLMRHADPGTINLVKSSSTFISAALLIVCLGRITSNIQWGAISIQVLGLIISQYDECRKTSSYSVSFYLILMLTVVAMSGCSVLNEYLIKSSGASLNALNFYLYGSGVIINALFYAYLRYAPESTEPWFFHGYGGLGSLVVLSNALIGLAITAVYKYANAVVKGLANSTSTAILLTVSLLMSWISPFRGVLVAGCTLVFLATFIYFSHPHIPSATRDGLFVKEDDEDQEFLWLPRLSQPLKDFSGSLKILGLFSAGIYVIAFIWKIINT